MNTSTDIRNQVIDQLLAINDKDFLVALRNMIDRAHVESPVITLTEEQKLMLTMSESDIAEGKVVDQALLHEQELKWLKRK